MNTHRPDDEHLPGEDELAALYRKLPHKEPGPALDAAVLRAAARAVEAAVPATPKRRARWPVALGSAAVLVLAAGLGWRMRDMPASAPPATPAAVTVHESAAVPAAAPAAQAATGQLAANAADNAAVPPPPAAAPVLAQRAMAAKLRKPETIAGNAPLAERLSQAQQPPVADYAAEAAPAMAAPKSAPAFAPVPAPAAGAPPAQRIAAATPAMAPAAPAPADTARDAADTPAQELDKIRRLFAERHREEARQRLADFHRDHPDYPLPDDLREQLLTP